MPLQTHNIIYISSAMRGDRARRAGHQPCQTAASQVSLEALEQGLVVGSEDGCDSGDVSAWFLTFSVAQQGPALPTA